MAAGGEPPPIRYRYGDHPSGLAIIGEGETKEAAIAQVACGVAARYVEHINEVGLVEEKTIEAKGFDLLNLILNFLRELLYKTTTPVYFITRDVIINELNETGPELSIQATLHGERFDPNKHGNGSEIRAPLCDTMTLKQEEQLWILHAPFDA